MPATSVRLTAENCTPAQNKSSPDVHVAKVCPFFDLTKFRTKTLIADQLPTKTDKVVFCPLTDTQREAYENLMECEDIQLIKYRGEKCHCGSGQTRGGCCYSTNTEGIPIDKLIFPYPSHPLVHF